MEPCGLVQARAVAVTVAVRRGAVQVVRQPTLFSGSSAPPSYYLTGRSTHAFFRAPASHPDAIGRVARNAADCHCNDMLRACGAPGNPRGAWAGSCIHEGAPSPRPRSIGHAPMPSRPFLHSGRPPAPSAVPAQPALRSFLHSRLLREQMGSGSLSCPATCACVRTRARPRARAYRGGGLNGRRQQSTATHVMSCQHAR